MIKVGCCGFPGGMKTYFKKFELVEVQSTFYELPRIKTVEGWRNAAGKAFEFTVKAWQAITHPLSSPTWRRARIEVRDEKENLYGFFRPSGEVFEAWERTKEICNVLEAEVCVVQCPSSFVAEEQNIKNVRGFFSKIDRRGITIAWEPRGKSWTDEKVRGLCEDLDLTHCVDPFAREPVFFSSKGIAYFRLHGRPPGEKMYNYKYTDGDLSWVKEKFESLEARGLEVYCLFNNVYMGDDAERLTRLI